MGGVDDQPGPFTERRILGPVAEATGQPVAALRRQIGFALAGGHLGLALAALAGRLDYPHPPGPLLQVLEGTASATLWGPVHAACAAALVLTHSHWVRPGRERLATGASCGMWAAWAILTALWAVSAPIDLSLGGPVLGAMAAGIASVLTKGWETERARSMPMDSDAA